MPTYTQRYDDFDPDFVRRFPLPYLEDFGVQARLHDALDKAANLRSIILVVGPKGMGKSARVGHVRAWFDEREARRAACNNSYVPLRVHVTTNARRATYEETLVELLLSIDRREPTKDRGRRKSAKALLERICELLVKKQIAVLLVDESETLTQHTLNALRDVVALSTDVAMRQGAPAGSGAGLVVIGTPASETVLRRHDEYGQRMNEIVRIPEVSIADSVKVLTTWMPQAAALTGDKAAGLQNVVRLSVCRDRATNMRRLWAVTTEYARRLDRMGRLKRATGWLDVPMDLRLLAAVANDQIDPGDPDKGPGGPNA